jgi:lipoprotein-anchoring transpeptidase ErfK/SrfK
MKGRKKPTAPATSPRSALLGLIALLLVLGVIQFLTSRPGKEAFQPPRGRPVATPLEMQIALARQGFSPGSIDGLEGEQTAQALRAFQASRQLEPNGTLDAATHQRLRINDPVFAQLKLEAADFARIDPPVNSWRERQTRARMGYHSMLEMIAEQSQSDPDLIRSLNPTLDFRALRPGQTVRVPLMAKRAPAGQAALIRIDLGDRVLQAVDAEGRILLHAPVSIARSVDKRPEGELQVEVRVSDPNYTFNPAILTAAAARENITEKFIIQPGPNNPVGTVWIGLDRPSYGIHGTPAPEQVGRTESSGCFRLANWNAEALLPLVEVGTPVIVQP